MELTLGPVLYGWKRDDMVGFYDRVVDMAVDVVYLGEVICEKKRNLRPEDVEAVAEKLTRAGKKVVVSSLAVVSNEKELDLTRTIAGMPYAVEANDMSVLNMVDASVKEVYAGPHITSYNVPSVEALKDVGIKGVTFPVELSREAIGYCIKETGVRGEVFAHGKVPLAFSWRCYISRAYGLNKSNCQHHCMEHPEGIELKTMDSEPVFRANGTSILSAPTYTLVELTDDLAEIGVSALRISPSPRDTARVVEIFRDRLEGRTSPEEALRLLKEAGEGEFCNGWYLGGAGKDYLALEAKAGA